MTLRARLAVLLKARHPLVVVRAPEEDRVLEALSGACLEVRRQLLTWTAIRGVCAGLFDLEVEPVAGTELPAAGLRWCWQQGADRVFACCDLLPHLDSELALRACRELVARARTLGSTVVLIDRGEPLPDCLECDAVRLAVPPPDDAELAQAVRALLERLRAEQQISVRLDRDQGQELVRLLRGLGRAQACRLVADAALEGGRLGVEDLPRLAAARARLDARHGLLEAVDPAAAPTLAGAARLKRWLAERRPLLDQGDHPDCPRGVLLLGVPGAGKSLCAKAVAAAWKRPLLRLEVGRVYDRYVGESERRLREALDQAAAAAPAVLWIDEIEKAFASAASQSTDGGLSQRIFGCLLTWMQERRGGVFLVATANDVSALPPELLRRGRFDEIFFVDLPSPAVRREILALHLRRRGHDPAALDLDQAAAAADGCTGADLEAAVAAAGIAARGAGAPLTSDRLLAALAEAPPLARLMPERIAALRAWAHGRCRMADDE
jgi:hypothetical protein